MPATWWDYVIRTAGTDVQKQMAADTGISETAFSRWKKGQNKPEAPHVIVFARAYGRPPVEALIAAGILRQADASGAVEIHHGPDQLTDDELVRQIEKRLKEARHVMETASSAGTPREADQDEEDDLDRTGGTETDTAAARTRRAFRRQPAKKRSDS